MFRTLFMDTYTTSKANSQPTVTTDNCSTTKQLFNFFLADTEMIPIRKKRIRFNSTVLVYLIPFNTEYNADLWYESMDYACFHDAYFAKIRVIMERHLTDWRTARDILNKTSILYDESFFPTEN